MKTPPGAADQEKRGQRKNLKGMQMWYVVVPGEAEPHCVGASSPHTSVEGRQLPRPARC